MADAIVRLRLDATDLRRGARAAGDAMEQLLSQGIRLAAGLRNAAAAGGQFARAAQGIGRVPAIRVPSAAQPVAPAIRAAAERAARVIQPAAPRPQSASIIQPGAPRQQPAPIIQPGAPRPQPGARIAPATPLPRPVLAPRIVMPDGTAAVRGLTSALEAGLRRAGARLGGATAEMLRHVDRRLPHSDAQTGPLSDLTRSGRAIPETLAAGVRGNTPRLTGAIDRMAADANRRVGQALRQMSAAARAAPDPLGVGQRLRSQSARMLAAQRVATRGDGAATLAAFRAAPLPDMVAAQRRGAGAGGPPGAVPGAGGSDGFARLWGYSALGGQVRQATQAIRRVTDASVGVSSELQTARAELATVLPDQAQRAEVMRRARETAMGRTPAGQFGITEAEYSQAAFVGVASGFSAQQSMRAAEQSVLLARAGQTTPKEAQIGLSDAVNIFGETFGRTADIYARAQDIGTFPRGIGELFSAVTKMGSTAAAAGMGMEETAAIATVLSRAGPRFRGATGGQAGMMAIREMEMGAMGRLGMATRRTADGGLDFAGNVAALAAADLSVSQINQAFGKRAAPAILQLIKTTDALTAGLGRVDGTAMENALEHLDTWETRQARFNAQMQVASASMGEGAIAARGLALQVGGGLLQAFNALGPGAAQAAGFAGQLVGVLGGVGVGILDMSVGLHAFKQLGGFKGVFRDAASGIAATRRGFAGMFGFMSRVLPLARGGIVRMFGAVATGIANALAAAAGQAAGGAVGGAVGGAAAGAGGTAAAGGGAATVAGTLAAGGGAVAAPLVAPLAVAAAPAVLIPRRKAEAEEQARIAAAAAGATPVETEAAVAEARAGERMLSRFQRAREEGAGLLGAVGQGLGFGRRGGNALGEAMDEALQPVADRLPQSDAKIGPLSDLTARGAAIPETLAAGIRQASAELPAALAEALPGASLPDADANLPGGAPAGEGQQALLRELVAAIRDNTAATRTATAPVRGDGAEKRGSRRRDVTDDQPPPWVLDYGETTGAMDALV